LIKAKPFQIEREISLEAEAENHDWSPRANLANLALYSWFFEV